MISCSKTYYVLKEYMPNVSIAEADHKQAVVEELVNLGYAVRQPELSRGSGKSFIGQTLLFDFITQYENNKDYVRFEVQIIQAIE